jgi:acyl-CoA synthetase (NDP forming)
MTKPALDYLFNPRSIALAGVSPDLSRPNLAQLFIPSLKEFGFKGEIYPLHPAGGEIFGMKVYKSVKDIKGEVDFVISAIPAKFTPQLMRDCVEKRVKAVHLFTSGYSEIEDEIGKHLETEILSIAKKGEVRMIGPNCMGIYCPSSGMTFSNDYPDQKGFSKKAGHLGFISQSGGNTIYAIRHGAERGVFFSKAISYGNAADLDETDFLDYMANDPDTKVIAMYVEGLKDGRRFRQVMSKALESKPVIVNKTGNTEAGSRTCASHTSAMAGSAAIWHDFLRQVGAIQVGSMNELADLSVALTMMPVPKGRNVVVMGAGGGAGVQAAEDISNAGLNLPMLPPEVRKKLHEIYGSEAGNMFRNPVDISPLKGSDYVVKAGEAIAASKDVDIIIIHFGFDLWAMISKAIPLRSFVEAVGKLAGSINKPLAVVLHYDVDPVSRVMADDANEQLVALGLPVYPSIGRAANAIAKYIDYNDRRSRRLQGK